MDNGRRKYVLILGTENTRTTSIWNEVFPVTVVSKQAVLIRFHPEQKLPALLLANLPHRHPNDIVVHHLVTFFDGAFHPSHMIVHSTSWRYEQQSDHLFPPEQIEWHHALAHALDHLASLSTYDPAIQAALEPEWREVLRPRCPKPAGCLQGCLSYRVAPQPQTLAS